MATFTITDTPFLKTNAQLFILPVNSSGKTLDTVVKRCFSLYPYNYNQYRDLCVDGSLKEGTSILVQRKRDKTGLGIASNADRPKYIANLVISDHPYHPPREKWILEALKDLYPKLYDVVRYEGIKRVAMLAHPLIFATYKENVPEQSNAQKVSQRMTAELKVPILNWESDILPVIKNVLTDLPKVHIDIHVPVDNFKS